MLVAIQKEQNTDSAYNRDTQHPICVIVLTILFLQVTIYMNGELIYVFFSTDVPRN